MTLRLDAKAHDTKAMTMTRIATLLTLITLAGISSACGVGMTARKYPPAQGPKGVNVRVTTPQGQLSGELIEVRDSGIVLADQKLRLIPYTDILSSEVEKTSSHYAIANRSVPTPETRDHLRLLSRFPYGLSAEVMQRLLSAYGQTELAGPN
jgi:hypothetical protein